MWAGMRGAWGALRALCAGRQHQRLLPPLLPSKLCLVSQGRCWEGLSKGKEVKNGERLSRKPCLPGSFQNPVEQPPACQEWLGGTGLAQSQGDS